MYLTKEKKEKIFKEHGGSKKIPDLLKAKLHYSQKE